MKDKLEDGGFDYNEVINAWRRKDYLRHSKNRSTLTVRINNSVVRCVVLNLKESDATEEMVEEIESNVKDLNDDDLPF